MEDGKKGKVRVVGQVPLIDGLRTPYHLFRDKFMHANQPVLISGLMLQWPAFRLWSSPSGLPNLDYLTSLFGSSQVQVAECSMRDFTDQKRVDMTVSEYIAYWKGLNSNTQNADSVESLLYLKDWHFVKDYPEYCAYTTPTFFMDDWLNFYLEHHQLHASDTQGKAFGCLSDYRFVYMGPKGTWTPLHADVLRSYSWSGNVCGKKLWHLLPPSETHHLYDRHRRNTVYDIYGDVLVKEFPNFHQAGWLECIQERGQILFVPSGWYHQVTNLEDAISINHNWFNGYNLHWVLELLLADYEEAKASIEDIRSIADDFEELCQRNLAANSGMDFYDFYLFLSRMTVFFVLFLRHSSLRDNELEKRQEESCFVYPDMRFICKSILSQILFNLHSIGCVIEHLASTDAIRERLLTFPKAGQKVEGQEGNIDSDRSRIEIGRFNSWFDRFQQSEYMTFLTDLISQHRDCMLDDTSDDTSEACICTNSNNIGLRSNVKTEDSQALHLLVADTANMKCLEKIARNDCDVVVSTAEDLEIKVNTARLLVQVIRTITDTLLQAYNMNL